MRIVFMFFFSNLALNLHAQGAWSSQFPLPELTEILTFSQPEEIFDEQSNALKALVYAVGIQTSLTPYEAGQWDTIPARGCVWRLGIKAENALSLNLLIENYLMHKGMALYVYNRNMENIAGPYDDRYNANGGILPIQSLPGDMIIVEWNIPWQTPPRNDFNIINIGYGFREIENQARRVRSAANDCNIDVNCLTGNHWQRQNRSVARLQTTVWNPRINRWVTQYCSGALINQAVPADRKKPYILTANHCVESHDEAQRTVVLFGYEKPYCDAPSFATPTTGIPGASLVATKRELDFSLLELPDNQLSATHRPFYAGWCNSGVAPQGVVGIHHPQGDVKKISVSSSLLRSSRFISGATDIRPDLICDPNAHWRVARWDEGLTEGGSSGSPIFNSDRRIVGTLSGGPPGSCTNAVNDEYSKFSEQWNRYAEADESLKQWLDPDNTGFTAIDGYDPLTTFSGLYEMTGNIGENENETLIKSGEWGYLTSLNDQQWVSFAEKIKNDTVAHIIGLEAKIAKVPEKGVNVRFAVWSGENFPLTTVYEKNVRVTKDYENYPMRVFFEDNIKIKGNYFIGYSLANTIDTDTFAVYHSPRRPYPGISSMFVEDVNGFWMTLEETTPPLYISLDMRAMGKFNIRGQSLPKPLRQNELKIVYLPSYEKALLLFSIDEPFASLHTVTIECYDTSGRRMLVLNNVQGSVEMLSDRIYLQVELDVSSLPPGVYIINTYDKKIKQAGKFVKM